MDPKRATLRRRLARRQQQKAELERQFHAARRQYQEKVAPLKEEVLRLRMERLRRAAQRHMRSAEHRNAYHDAQRAYESFQEAQEQEPAPPENLKALYRRASKRCHPDVVPDAYREEAEATFQALEAAYEAGHVRAVEAIVNALERWGFPRRGGSSADVAGRTRDPDHLRRAIADLEESIQSLRGTDAYQDLAEAGTLDALLHAQKTELLRQLREWRHR